MQNGLAVWEDLKESAAILFMSIGATIKATDKRQILTN